MSKQKSVPSSSASLLNDFSYLNFGDIDVSSKKGHGKYRYDSEHATNSSSSALKSDAFYFDGKIHNDQSQYFPDNNNAPPGLTSADFLVGDQHENLDDLVDEEAEEEGAYYDENGENDQAPEMPNEFYMQIDQFLKKPPPKINLDDPSGGEKKKKKKSLKHQQKPHFPPISQTSYDLYQNEYNLDQLPPPNLPQNEEEYLQQLQENQVRGKRLKKKGSNTSSTLYQNPINPNKDSKPRAIDNQLLREAFAYTDQLLREAVIEEANSMVNQDVTSKTQTHQPRSAPADLPQAKHKSMEDAYSSVLPTQNKSQKKKSGSSSASTASHKVNVVRQLKQQQQSKQIQHNSEFSIGTGIGDTEGPDLKRNAINFDELVYNFQHGVNLEKLRKELQQSKQSLAQSEGIIRDLSTQYLRK